MSRGSVEAGPQSCSARPSSVSKRYTPIDRSRPWKCRSMRRNEVIQDLLSADNPPGFIRDEAAFAFNAWSIGHHLRDQFGGFLPVYFKSFGDYKSPIFVYVLALVFRVTGAHDSVARGLATFDVLAGLGVFAVIAYRQSRANVALPVIILAGFCPLAVRARPCRLLLTHRCIRWLSWVCCWRQTSRFGRQERWLSGVPPSRSPWVSSRIATGRATARPATGSRVLVFLTRDRLRWLLGVWIGYAVLLIPLVVYGLRHPHGLKARYDATTFIHPGMSFFLIVGRAASNYVHDLSLWHWATTGDYRPYIDVPGYGILFASLAVLGVLGWSKSCGTAAPIAGGFSLWQRCFLVPVPAALTDGPPDALRLSPLPLMLAVFSLPGLELLLSQRVQPRLRVVLVALLATVTIAQWINFVDVYARRGTVDREVLYEAGVPALLAQAFADGRTVYIDHDDVYAQTHALWYAVSHGLPEHRVSVLPDGGIPPRGARAPSVDSSPAITSALTSRAPIRTGSRGPSARTRRRPRSPSRAASTPPSNSRAQSTTG